jgi:hypothetical protein
VEGKLPFWTQKKAEKRAGRVTRSEKRRRKAFID